MIRDNAGIEGFMGINGTMLEMLFVHPRAIGTGIGKQLIRYALEHCHVRYVDVNEQNKKASGFYSHFGFRVIGRDAKDASGEPYPILHLKLGGIMKIENWGLVPYSEAWERQTELFNAVVEAKQVGKTYENRIIFVEHSHVYTLGKSGKETNMLLGEAQLKMIGATLYHIDRGGDITYHGPGQLVCYPILNLEDYHLGLKEYIHVLEEAVIRVCASYGIEAGRVKGEKTVILISHRLANGVGADCIYMMENGRIAETGTHGELMGQCGSYRKLFESQSALEQYSHAADKEGARG